MCKLLLQEGIKPESSYKMRDKDGSVEGMRTQNHAAVMIYQRDSNLRVHHIVSYRLVSCHTRTQSRDCISVFLCQQEQKVIHTTLVI